MRRLRRWWRLWCAWDEVRHARRVLRYCPHCICRDYLARKGE